MPTRSYGVSSLVVVNETVISSGTFSNAGTKFDRFTAASYTLGENGEISYDAIGYINFNLFPTIPASASITRVACSGVASGALTTSGTGGGSSVIFISFTSYPGGSTIEEDGEALTIEGSYGQSLGWEIIYDPPKTRAQIITLFGSAGNYPTSGTYLGAALTCTAFADIITPGDASSNATLSSWTFEVTYDLENYSWYIKPTIKIVNGQPVKIIEDATADIVQVIDGEDPPEVLFGELPYEFYGTGEDFPDGPEYVWWESVDFYIFYIYSPITPSVPGITTWIPLAAPPACVGCLTLTLGSLDVLAADASGIYVLTNNKSNDTLYVRPDGGTVDVKIPNPRIRIAYLP